MLGALRIQPRILARALLRDRLEKLPDARSRSAYAALHAHQALLERDDYECA
jgi:hypothetical protein